MSSDDISALRRELFYRVLAQVKDRDTAEDIVQTAFAKAFSSGGYAETGKFRNYVSKICRNVMIDHFRKKRTTTPLDYAKSVPVQADSPWDRETARRLNEAIERLPPDQRRIIRLHYLEDMKYGEISTLDGTCVNTLLARARHAREKLKKMLRSD